MRSGTSEAARLSLSSAELKELASTVLSRQFGIQFSFHQPPTSAPNAGHSASSQCGRSQSPSFASIARQSSEEARVLVRSISERLQALAIPLRNANRVDMIAIGIFASTPSAGVTDDERASDWLSPSSSTSQVRYCQPELLLQLGEAALTAIFERGQLSIRETELKQLAAQLTRDYEEITLLHQLTREAQISQDTTSLQQMTLTLLAEILPISQVALVSLCQHEATLSQGKTVLQPSRCGELMKALGAPAAQNVLVDNRLSERGLPAEFASLGRLVSVPVFEGNEQFGWLIALGRSDDADVGSVEASLMTAVAAIVATHQSNVQLYRDIKELFLGIVRALTSAIDAKDPNTCGHSERVARLAYQIAQRMELPEDQQNKVYLSGLLHDVGKIGIRDSVLLKTGRLTEQEMSHMKQHPSIGFDILSPVRQLRPVLSAVRGHHENMDGTGYPDGLKGEEITLMARIVAAADSYDAMSSHRPYRPALRMPEILRIFREGSSKQWDSSVIAVLLSILQQSDCNETHSKTCTLDAGTNATNATPAPKFAAMDLSSLRPSNFDRY
jgi:HD-GYP domain-containing protein (c-di-GMP phosphodiesterase class II)